MDSLVDKIKEWTGEEATSNLLTEAGKAALALSEQFDDIEPDEDVLPLDALAGCWVEIRATKD